MRSYRFSFLPVVRPAGEALEERKTSAPNAAGNCIFHCRENSARDVGKIPVSVRNWLLRICIPGRPRTMKARFSGRCGGFSFIPIPALPGFSEG